MSWGIEYKAVCLLWDFLLDMDTPQGPAKSKTGNDDLTKTIVYRRLTI